MKTRSFLLLGTLAFLAGCASRSTVSLANRFVTPEEIHDAVRANHARIRSMNAEGKLTVETPELAQTASFVLNIQKPDSVMLRIEGPFGIEVGAAIVTREEFLFYNILQNKVISGSTNPSNLSKILRVDVSFEDLLNMFSGGAFFKEDLYGAGDLTVEDDHFVLTYRQSLASRKYWIEPSTLLILRVQHLDEEGKLMLEQKFNSHTAVQEVSIPFNVQLTQPKERRRVSIAYTDLRVNAPSSEFTIHIPSNAERVRMQ